MENKKKILVIDNDRAFTILINKFFTDVCGYEVEIVPDGYNGIISAGKNNPGVILLDIRMPAMNGLGVLEKLKFDEKTAHIPVIVLTGFDDEEVKNKALALKAADYLAKPLDLEELRRRVEMVIK